MSKLRRLLKRRKMTGRQLAREMGLSDTAVSFYMSGKRVPTLKLSRKMAKILNITLDELAEMLLSE